MTDYVKITDYAAKDSLLSGDPAKLVRGAEIGADFDAVATAVATKADEDGATLTNVNIDSGTVDGTVIGATTPASGTFTTLTSTGNATLGDSTSLDSHTINGVTAINTNSASAALTITQAGAGDCLRVNDASGDTTPFVIDASGRVVVGHTATLTSQGYTPAVQVIGSASASAMSLGGLGYSSITGRFPHLLLGKSASDTIGTEAAVASGDTLGRIAFGGSDGTAQIPAVWISAEVDGTTGTNDMPGRLVFSTTADGASLPTEAMRINSSRNVGIGGDPGSTLRLYVKGADTGTTNYACNIQNSASTNLMIVRNDGQFQTGVAAASPYNNTTASASNVFVTSTGILQRSTSSKRYKTDVETLENDYADAIVFGARPVWYRSLCEGDNAGWGWYGLIAEEMAAIDPRLVHWGHGKKTITLDDGTTTEVTDLDSPLQPEGVQYDRIVAPLINVAQRHETRIAALESAVFH